MGGRVASMIADELFEADRIAGLLCVGYPFHPIGKPDRLRTEHLKKLRTPTLICQGTRDQFGSKDEVSEYNLSSAIQLRWFEDGDHDLKPRKRISGFTHADHLNSMAAAAIWRARAPRADVSDDDQTGPLPEHPEALSGHQSPMF